MEKLLEFCNTDRQREYVQAVIDNETMQSAADSLGMTKRALQKALQVIRERAEKKGVIERAGINRPTADHLFLKGHSDFINEETGEISRRWLKYDTDKVVLHAQMIEAIESTVENVPARPSTKLTRKNISSKLLNMFTFTDYHIGMLAWHKEGGSDWNVDIAKETLIHCLDDMIERSPNAETALINQLGDFFHWDGMAQVTPTSGHLLDADTRPEKMIQVAIECMEYMIVRCLETHKRVKVVIAQGNHDLYSSLFLRVMFKRLYRDESRLEVIESSNPYYAYKFGSTLLGFHHGHKQIKPDALSRIFSDEFRELSGSTERTCIHIGHHHHKEVKELGKTTVEMHRTLAARDSHASYGGYHAERASDVITYHEDHGEFERRTVRPKNYT